jgi:hypothetical protein
VKNPCICPEFRDTSKTSEEKSILAPQGNLLHPDMLLNPKVDFCSPAELFLSPKAALQHYLIFLSFGQILKPVLRPKLSYSSLAGNWF